MDINSVKDLTISDRLWALVRSCEVTKKWQDEAWIDLDLHVGGSSGVIARRARSRRPRWSRVYLFCSLKMKGTRANVKDRRETRLWCTLAKSLYLMALTPYLTLLPRTCGIYDDGFRLFAGCFSKNILFAIATFDMNQVRNKSSEGQKITIDIIEREKWMKKNYPELHDISHYLKINKINGVFLHFKYSKYFIFCTAMQLMLVTFSKIVFVYFFYKMSNKIKLLN